MFTPETLAQTVVNFVSISNTTHTRTVRARILPPRARSARLSTGCGPAAGISEPYFALDTDNPPGTHLSNSAEHIWFVCS